MRKELFKVSAFIKLIVLVFVVFSLTQTITLARSGCCSHHGGVCGCSCCDGKSLSATCAPYYPSCNNNSYSKPTITPPTAKPKVKTYSEAEYKTIISEKSKLTEEKNILVSEKENLIKELNTIKKEKEAKEKEANHLKEACGDKGILSAIDETQTAIVKPKEQTVSKNANSNGGGFMSFLLGGGMMYGASRLKRRQEMKKEGVQIKGNITKDGQKIYYTPDNRYYPMVRINKKRGERWFVSEDEALNAGWRKV